MLEKLTVNLEKKTYSIMIGFDLFETDKMIFPITLNSQIVVITDKIVSNIWNNKVIHYFSKFNIKVKKIVISDGEKHKRIKTVEFVISNLLRDSYGRDTILVALGGGVIGDLTGFIASIYQRGIRFIQIPTTLLSQVDASIGGKTSVNHILGKNMIGSFWQPSSVITNLNFLNTLPQNQFISGLSEVIKYAIAFDKEFFNWLEENLELVVKLDRKALFYCIKRCCKIKIGVVEQDEKEISNRMLLNLGHTYGHAIETYLGYGRWLHGEAVSVGIVMAATTSELLGFLSNIDKNRIIFLLKRAGLPINRPKEMTSESYISLFYRDKKTFSGTFRIILPVSIGKAKVFSNIKINTLLSAIEVC